MQNQLRGGRQRVQRRHRALRLRGMPSILQWDFDARSVGLRGLVRLHHLLTGHVAGAENSYRPVQSTRTVGGRRCFSNSADPA